MKNKCRILSVIVTVILTSITLITTINLIIKPKDEIIYAESINFVNGIRSAEILLDNRLVVDENLVEVAPKNCSFTPEFTIKKYGTSEETVINGYYTFPKTGTYTIACKINSGKNYYEKDSMSITIVETPTSSTIMYIIDKHVSLHENDEIDLFSVANIVKPENSSIKVETNSNLQFYNNTIKAVKEGKGEINITLTYYNIIINKEIIIDIKPKIVEDNIKLNLSIENELLNNNVIEINSTKYNYAFNYELLNIDSQTINYWTEENIFEIININSPLIIIKPLTSGISSLYISPVEYPDIIFEIVIKIN